MYTNINISNNIHTCSYVVEYNKSIKTNNVKYDESRDVVNLIVDGDGDYKVGEITLYFPTYSVDTYKSTDYKIECGIWIGNKFVRVLSETINRMDATACDQPTNFGDNTYYEMYKFCVVDVFDLIYSDIWKEFREGVCNEAHTKNHSFNTTGSILYITLHPVNNEIDNEWVGGQSSMNITNEPNNYFHINLSSNTSQSLKVNEAPALCCDVVFNEVYDNLDDYLMETYLINEYDLLYELVIGNDEMMGGVIQSDLTDSPFWIFEKEDIKDFMYDGMSAKASLHIMDKNGESLLYMMSNTLPLTEEIIKYFRGSDFMINKYVINNVQLSDVNMDVFNISAVNQLRTNVVKVSHNGNNVSHIKPIFYRVVDASSIVIHSEVSEIICINLDRYNHLVDRYILSINGTNIIEHGRNNNGVLFKIPAKMKKGDGRYYVLNEDSEMITSGKYICE